jgi:hypothetical protein
VASLEAAQAAQVVGRPLDGAGAACRVSVLERLETSGVP